MSYIGSNKITGIYYNNNKIVKAYYNGGIVFSADTSETYTLYVYESVINGMVIHPIFFPGSTEVYAFAEYVGKDGDCITSNITNDSGIACFSVPDYKWDSGSNSGSGARTLKVGAYSYTADLVSFFYVESSNAISYRTYTGVLPSESSTSQIVAIIKTSENNTYTSRIYYYNGTSSGGYGLSYESNYIAIGVDSSSGGNLYITRSSGSETPNTFSYVSVLTSGWLI